MPMIPQSRFLKGLNAATPSTQQPAGTVPRVSNLLLTKRGGFITTPGSTTLSKLDNVLVHTAPVDILELALFQPATGPARYFGIIRDPSAHLNPPSTLAAVNDPAAPIKGLPAGDVFWVVTGIDGTGGETTISNVATLNFPAPNNAAILTWAPLVGAILYNVYRSVDGGVTYNLITPSGIFDAIVQFEDFGAVADPATHPPVINTTQSCFFLSIDLPSYNRTTPLLQLPAANETSQVADNLGQVPTNTGGVPTQTGSTPPTPQGGIVGNISELPQLLQFNNKLIAILGNSFAPQVSDGTPAGTAAVSNTFVPDYPLWATSIGIAVNDIIQATVGGTAYVFKATQAGVTGLAAPAFSAIINKTISDGTVIWVNIGAVSAIATPIGAAHGIIYAGFLWLYNTAPQTNSSKTAGPTALQMSDLNNPNSWNPLNIVFIGKDDGTQGTGLATFSVSETGIIPTGSLIAFKDFTTFQIFGVLGDPAVSIVQAQTDMGNIAPRSIQFIPGYGIARLTHLGPAVFDGVRDRLLGPEIYPYIFGGESDIVPVDWGEAYLSKGSQSATPPMYILAVPLQGSEGLLTRILCFDLVLKSWTIVDLPFPITCLKQIRIASQGTQPLTVCGSAGDAALRRLFVSTVAGWQDSPSLGVTSPVSWRVRTPKVVSKSTAERIGAHALYVRGATRPTTIAAQVSLDTGSLPSINMKVVVQNGLEFEALLQMHLMGKSVGADITGTGPVELHSFNWDVDVMPAVPSVLI